MSEDLPEHVAENRRYWDRMAHEWAESGARNWARDEPTWGVWGIPESELGMLPADMAGLKAVELGCGTGYVSAWMTRRGAAVVAIDNSAEQLATARRLAGEHGLAIEWIHGDAEAVPAPDGAFDFAISEYGAAIWCDPDRWVPEAHRLLKPGGTLVFLGNHPLVMTCMPPSGEAAETTLQRPYFGIGRFDWRAAATEPGGIEFNRTVSAWVRLFRETGFEVLDYLEPRAPAEIAEERFFVAGEWARKWPSEQVWKLRKRG